jgi:hypothetical protein
MPLFHACIQAAIAEMFLLCLLLMGVNGEHFNQIVASRLCISKINESLPGFLLQEVILQRVN